MDKRELLFGLHEIAGIGWKSIDKICRSGYLSEEGLSCREEEWRGIGLSVAVAQRLAGMNILEWIKERRLLIEERGLEMVTVFDGNYPAQLKETAQPPWVLYYKGDIGLTGRPVVAMVGTRVPTAYGRKVGEMLAEELSRGGVTVASGLARGIDSVCHEAALRGEGSTIAVMATGFDKIYPPDNRELERDISRRGLVLSEYPLGTPSHPGLFPQRNRIIAGLALGTVVVEADSRSGSLITADAALEAGRDVFAVPGPLTSPKSRGALELIKQGAKLVTCAGDILEEYAHLLPLTAVDRESGHGPAAGQRAGLDEKKLTNDEQQLYHILQQGPFTLDELLGRSGWHFGHLHSVLLSLIIQKAVAQLPGAIYKVI
ncbi:DNA-processing protein DprA [Paenibacillus tepidiphilus]|uniref:DNA-processing protein DprA n=1 Tax=Paenibacillus tepidiphilus TaxID=2608683 RepID=UPI00123B00A0|nr:DNA-processing protein DprA [Paenibacillus tepidiphilus]